MDSLVRQDSLVLQDPVAYSSLPSAPQPSAPHTIVTVRPEPLTIRLVSVHTASAVTANRQWLCYCCFIIFVFLFGGFLFYHMLYDGRKN